MSTKPINIGFVSTRFAGSDGVSLETAKWAGVLTEDLGHRCLYFAGECDRPADISMVDPKAYYRHPEIKNKHDTFFGKKYRSPSETKWIYQEKEALKEKLLSFLGKFNIGLWIIENALAIPLHIPLGWAITEIIAETGIPTIAHHHDFSWERKRFLVNCVEDYINMAFPPNLDAIQHVVINSHAHHQLARRRGTSSVLVPNVMDFSTPPPGPDDYNADLRDRLGLQDDELFILQPTRIIERKGIEHAIELVQRIGTKARLVISHASGDEGHQFAKRIQDYSELLKVKLICAEEFFRPERHIDQNGRKFYSIWDAYIRSDLVTYPSEFEGFGNAFLEAVYFQKPIVVNNYSIFSTDIRPKGFHVIEFDDYVTDKTVERTVDILNNPARAKKWTEKNFLLARKYYSYEVLETKLRILIANAFGTNNLNL
jgi:glycosyltransferase involved in cell wall biosynthesis